MLADSIAETGAVFKEPIYSLRAVHVEGELVDHEVSIAVTQLGIRKVAAPLVSEKSSEVRDLLFVLNRRTVIVEKSSGLLFLKLVIGLCLPLRFTLRL